MLKVGTMVKIIVTKRELEDHPRYDPCMDFMIGMETPLVAVDEDDTGIFGLPYAINVEYKGDLVLAWWRAEDVEEV